MNNLSKIQKRIFIIVIIIVLGIVGYYIYGRNSNNTEITKEEEILVKTEENTTDLQDGKIIVHITGAVKKEGIVTLRENSRIADAIEEAGGLKEDADMSKINLAYVLEDGIKIKIPSINDKEENEEITKDEEVVENTSQSNAGSENNKSETVNINKASQTELETLPGIGPSTALKIINYRNENGKFSSIEDLKKVSGIGDSKFDNIKDLISVK